MLIGEEATLPYDRPPLSKAVLQGRDPAEAVVFHDEEQYRALDIDVQLGVRAERADFHARRLTTEGGNDVSFDGLIIATGASPKRLEKMSGYEGVYYLRTLQDCLALKHALSKSTRVVVIGAGFIGAEVASSACQMGVDVTVVDASPRPFAAVLGDEVGRRCVDLHRRNGVRYVGGVEIKGVLGSSRVEGVRLADECTIPADVIVVGVGVAPNTRWLRDAGLCLDDGVPCDECGYTGIPHVFAAGDVASWYTPLLGKRKRIEHWANAREQGRIVAHNLLRQDGEMVKNETIPYFWSDQYDTKIQCAGYTAEADEASIVYDDTKSNRLAAIYRRGDRIAGVTTLNSPRHLARYRALVARRSSWVEAVEYVA